MRWGRSEEKLNINHSSLRVMMMSSQRSYRHRAFAFPLLGAAYVAIALVPPPAGSLENFPFFNWTLFSQTSDEKSDVIALVHAINGEELSEPVSFYDLPEEFAAARARDALFMKLMDQFALAIDRGDEAKIRAFRGLVEEHFMRDAAHVEYEVALVRYHPFERYRQGKLRSVEVFARYTKG